MIDSSVLDLADAMATKTEAGGVLHPDVVAALTEHGIFRRWVAAEFGGHDMSVVDMLDEIEILARADGATGWCTMIANTTALTSHHLPTTWADTIYSDPNGCTGGFGMPSATGIPDGDDLIVTGRWAWGSGTDHCTWIGGGVRIVDADGSPTTTTDGASTPFVFFSPDQVELLDTWHVSGLKGTGSTDYSVASARVPAGRWTQLVGGEPRLDSALARFPFFGALGAGVAAVMLGLGGRAIDELTELGSHRFSGSAKGIGERAPVQSDLARAQVAIAQARSHLHETARAVQATAADGSHASDDQRVALRLAASGAADRALEAVDRCYHAVGGTAIYETSPLQRVFRDAHVAIAHGMIAPRTFEAFGRYGFGLPPPPPNSDQDPMTDLYETMSTLRAVRRLRTDPIADEVLQRVLQAACWSPTGGNQQPWRVVVVRDDEGRSGLHDIYAPLWDSYRAGFLKRMESMPPEEFEKWKKVASAGDYLADHLREAPAILVFCANPKFMAITDQHLDRVSMVGGGSVYPAVQNAMLACVAEGLGCTLTTLHCQNEQAVKDLLQIPDGWATVAMVPVGWPVGKGHGPITRKPPEHMAYANRFGEAWG